MGFEWGFPWHKHGIFQQISLDCQSVYGISMTINVYIYGKPWGYNGHIANINQAKWVNKVPICGSIA
jgi:hypothetical protein